MAKVAPADHAWKPGQQLNLSSPEIAGGPYQGSPLKLDITSIVQAWADSAAANNGLALDGDVPLVIYNMVILDSSCATTYSSAALNVTY